MSKPDYLRVEHSLEDGEVLADGWYQTNSLNRIQAFFVLTSDGRLMRQVAGKLVDTEYHGGIEFFDDGFSYTAEFTDGQLQRITRLEVPDDEPPEPDWYHRSPEEG